MTPSKACIYVLKDPETLAVRYVGQTIVHINQRLRKHIADSNKNNQTHCRCWIRGLSARGLRPIIEPIEYCDISILDDREIYHIAEYKKHGHDLTNIALGGQARKIFSEETKKKISITLTGKKQSEETKQKRSESAKITWSDETLRVAQRERTSRLNRLGVTGTKGKPSKKKGKPFDGDRVKVSESLKEYFKTNRNPNRISEEKELSLILDYVKGIPVSQIAKNHSVNRNILTNIMRRNNIPFRHKNKKYDTIESVH